MMRWFIPAVVRRTALLQTETSRPIPWRRWSILTLVSILVVCSAVIGVRTINERIERLTMLSQMPLEVSVPNGAQDVLPSDPLSIYASTGGNKVTNVQLWEARRAPVQAGAETVVNWLEEAPLPVVADNSVPTYMDSIERLVVQDGYGASPLSIDAHYRLVVEGKRLKLQFPQAVWEPWQEEYTFQTVQSPVAVATLPSYTLMVDESIKLQWSQPMKSVACRTEAPATCRAEIDANDPTTAQLMLSGIEQGASYPVSITEAIGVNGLSVLNPQSFIVNTPPGIAIAAVGPEDGAHWLEPSQEVVITFDQVIADRSAAESAISFDPPVQGHFSWSEDGRTVTFQADSGFPWQSEVMVRVKGSRSVRSVSGGYLERGAEWSFLTRPNKTIDVDLSRQVLTALDGGEVAFTLAVATGVRGAETPTGTYYVQTKLPICRMAGVNPSGLRYDIPDVPWVMPYDGDYTIHGAYWRARFGTPGSNGCVSMSVPDSKRLFDWSPVGTRIVIHY